MTTPAAEKLYLAQHQHALEGRGWAVYNPHLKSFEELPVIMGFNNGGSYQWYQAVALAEDGTFLGSHICSHEGYMENDLGILEGTGHDRHEDSYKKHYPDGYRMEFVPYELIKHHEKLLAAIEKSKAMANQEEQTNDA